MSTPLTDEQIDEIWRAYRSANRHDPATTEQRRELTRIIEAPLLAVVTELQAKLDICKRYAQGEAHDPVHLAVDYGGTGWESDPACMAVGELALRFQPSNPQCLGSPGECEHNGGCMYDCKSATWPLTTGESDGT